MKTLGGREGLGDFALCGAASWVSLKRESDAARMQGTGEGRLSPADSKRGFPQKSKYGRSKIFILFLTMCLPGQPSNNNHPEIALP